MMAAVIWSGDPEAGWQLSARVGEASRSIRGADWEALSSHSAFRSRVVPEPPEDTTARRPPPAQGDQLRFLECLERRLMLYFSTKRSKMTRNRSF